MSDPVIERIVSHLAAVAKDGVPNEAREAAKIFIADTFGVGAAGAAAPWAAEVQQMAAPPGGHEEAAVWGTVLRLPLAAAAMVNAFQVHCQEFDCVHEGAVV